MKLKYTTVQGDTFDLIASKTLGSENLMGAVIKANRSMAHVLVFGAGAVLEIPDLTDAKTASKSGQPPWRASK